MNKEAIAIVQNNPQRFGWFACLTDWTDLQGTLDEIEWAVNVAKADGVVIMSAYKIWKLLAMMWPLLPTGGSRLLRHHSFEAIWDKLDALQALVFIHPTSIDMCVFMICCIEI